MSAVEKILTPHFQGYTDTQYLGCSLPLFGAFFNEKCLGR